MALHLAPAPSPRFGPFVTRVAGAASAVVLRYGLALFLVGGGLAKFTSAEALTIQPWIAHSPFLGWLYAVTTVQAASITIGIIELIIGALLAVRHWWPRLSAFGSLAACIQFVITFSFLFTTPGLSTDTQGFLMKDLMLFGAAAWTAADSLRATESNRR
jgi:uncharacterized membrane protein YkgB